MILKNLLKLPFITLLYSTCFLTPLWGQTKDNPATESPRGVLPPAPDAAALGRYGDSPTSLYRGIPNISVALSTFTVPGVSIPISLDYNASGIKVDDVASSVGLGWALNAGGVITCVVHGKSDLSVNRVMPVDIRTFSPSFDTNPTDYEFARRLISEGGDTEPDVFYFNFAGKTGKFVLSEDRKQILTIPYQPLLIQYGTSSTGITFTVTDEQGIRYEFNAQEQSNTSQECDVFVPGRERNTAHGSSWYLSKITTPLGAQISLAYSSVKYSFQQGNSETLYYQPNGPSGSGSCADLSNKNATCISTQHVRGKRLAAISSNFNDTRIEFSYSSLKREDVEHSDSTGNNALEYVRVRQGSKLVQEHHLTYTYFRSPGFTAAMPSAQKALYSRLRLDAVQQTGEPAHRFTYNTQVPLPQRLSFAQDFWGYFNGSLSNQTLISRSTTYGFGANRAPSPGHILADILTQITYPTGGKTVFTYESNHHYGKQQLVDFTVGSFSVQAPEDRPSATDTLVIAAGSQNYDGVLSWSLPNANGERTTGSITGPDGIKRFLASGSGSEVGTLPPGTYIVNVIDRNHDGASIGYSWKVPHITYRFADLVDRGIRVATIRDFPGGQGAVKTRRYRYPGDTKETSQEAGPFGTPFGVSYATDNLGAEYKIPRYDDQTLGVAFCTYRIFSGASVPSLGGDDDGVAFAAITEYLDSSGVEGRTRYTFTRSLEDFIGQSEGEPNDGWARGLPLTVSVDRYDKQQQKYYPVKQTENAYYAHHHPDSFWTGDVREAPNHERHVSGYQIRYVHPEYVQVTGGEDGPTGFIVTRAEFIVDTYVYSSVWYYLKEKKETLFDPADAARFTTSTSFYRYGNPAHAQLTQHVQTANAGTLLSTKFRYPLDYDTTLVNDEAAQALQLLAKRHMLTPVVEQQQWRYKGGGPPLFIGGSLLHYVDIFKKRTWQAELAAPVDSSAYVASSIRGGVFTQDRRYKEREVIDQFDFRGNVLQQHRTNGPSTSYEWGYRANYPIVEALNTTYEKFAFAGFELDEYSKWVPFGGNLVPAVGYTGRNSYRVDGGTLSVSSLPAATYVVSCWLKQGSGTPTLNGQAMTAVGRPNREWRRYQGHVSLSSQGSITLGGSGQIDELRLHPVEAQLSTVTYDPLVGVTSKTDASQRTIYYEYDAMGRLQRVRDEQGRVLTEQQYSYSHP